MAETSIATGTLTLGDLVVPASIFTLDGFRRWAVELDEDAPRIHYCAGEVVIEMSPQDLFSHLPVASAINSELHRLARDLDLGEYYEGGCWITNRGADLSTEPDGCLVLWETFTTGAARPVRAASGGAYELDGRIDMALEVVSRSSRKKDTQTLVRAYAQAGVREYWLVDARGDELLFRLLVLEGEGYREVAADGEGFRASRLFGRRFRLARSTNRAGLPSVRLEDRPLA